MPEGLSTHPVFAVSSGQDTLLLSVSALTVQAAPPERVGCAGAAD